MSRGTLTEEIQSVALTRLGREISKVELRLIPYIQYLMVNEQKLDPNKINSEEREIWFNWKKEGYVAGGMTGMYVSQMFWTFMLEVLWFGYVGEGKLDVNAVTDEKEREE